MYLAPEPIPWLRRAGYRAPDQLLARTPDRRDAG